MGSVSKLTKKELYKSIIPANIDYSAKFNRVLSKPRTSTSNIKSKRALFNDPSYFSNFRVKSGQLQRENNNNNDIADIRLA